MVSVWLVTQKDAGLTGGLFSILLQRGQRDIETIGSCHLLMENPNSLMDRDSGSIVCYRGSN